ncbi:uncharacterized protein LOC133304398 [Gastrolobium bilobum]|uniref:uncharacterized protein LOC133304398 n=1 Tax=Gastrolobium bilobum TaxID=150636 RepID=UPI002AB06FF3|nr:uncharacterized protein LOC133304398 [Gastrolobium bilobum]
MSRQLAERNQGQFPSNTIVNPREDCKSIVTRSEIVITPQEKPKVVQKKKADEPVIEPEQEKEEETPANEKEEPAKKDKGEANEKAVETPKNGSHKECSAIIQKKFTPKLRDPRSFNIPIAIGNINVGRALCDLGASINLMPLSVMKSLEIFELKPTMVSLQPSDRSLRRPNEVIEDVLVKVGKFIFHADFVVLDMEEEGDMPLLLGRPFRATARAMIGVEKGKLELRMDDEKVAINIFDVMKHAEAKNDCFRVDILEELFLEKKDDGQTLEEETKFFDENPRKENSKIPMEELKKKDSDITVEAPEVELKELSSTLKYIFLGDTETYPVIINKELSDSEETKLMKVLKDHQTAIGWFISDLKGTNLSFCTHKILMEDNIKPVRKPQRRLNPTMKEVVRKEVVKLLDADMIYPISDTAWIPVAPEDQEKTTFTCLFGVFAYRRMPFGLCNAPATFQRRFIKDFSKIAKPLSQLLVKDTSFNFDEECLHSFNLLKEKLTIAPVLMVPDWNLPFELMCDVSAYAIGAVLGHRKDKLLHVIYYASKVLNEAQVNYATTEKEMLAVVYALDKFRPYLIRSKIIVFTDHAALKYLMSKQDAKPRLLRWMLLFQEFDLEIRDKKGLKTLRH